MTLSRSELIRLAGVKTVANTALRWIPPFLPTLEAALGATTTQLTTIMGTGELAGLSTIAVGPSLDRRRERMAMAVALGAITASSVIALIGTTFWFGVAFVVLVLGVSNYTVAGQAYISHRVAYRRRARSLGLFEVSWALALLVGAPIIALLIDAVGWRGPFVALAVASAIGAVVVVATIPRERARVPTAGEAASESASFDRTRSPRRPTARAWAVMVGSGATAMAGLAVFVVSGSWLDDEFGLSIARLGAVAMAFGAVELTASLSSASFADRVGKMRCTLAGIVVLAVGLVLVVAADTLAVAVAGLLTFLLGFEFAFVTSLSLVSEAMPEARGTTLATSNGVGTLARASGAVAGGALYGVYGIAGTAALSGGAAALAAGSLILSRRCR